MSPARLAVSPWSPQPKSPTDHRYRTVGIVLLDTGRRRPGRFSLDGADVSVPRQGGSLTAQPVSRDDYRELIEGDG
jgi:hypothetical protein